MLDKNLNMPRREFLRSCLRNSLLTSLAFISGMLMIKREPNRSEQTCFNQGICCGCHVFKDCLLPQAQSAKEAGLRETAKDNNE